MLRKNPTGGQEAIRIFNEIVRPQLNRLWRENKGLIARLHGRVEKIYKTIPHTLNPKSGRRELESLEKHLKRLIDDAATSAKQTISRRVSARRNTVTVDIKPIEHKDPSKEKP